MNSSFTIDPILAVLATRARQEPEHIFLVLTATEAEAQQFTKGSLALASGSLGTKDILYFPGFVQAGVFRYESARRILAHRIAALHQFSKQCPRIIVTSVAGISRISASTEWVDKAAIHLSVAQECDIDPLVAELRRRDYSLCERVDDIGDFSVRGGIIDFWTPGQKNPTRLEFFGDTLDKIRLFRKGDQRSFEQLQSISILPMREFIWEAQEASEVTIEKVNKYILNQGIAGRHRTEIIENIRYGIPFPGVDDFASVFSGGRFESLSAIITENAQKLGKNFIYLQLEFMEFMSTIFRMKTSVSADVFIEEKKLRVCTTKAL